jgi:hypothetical protein
MSLHDTESEQPESMLEQAIQEARPRILANNLVFGFMMLNVVYIIRNQTAKGEPIGHHERIKLTHKVQGQKRTLMHRIFGETPSTIHKAVFDKAVAEYVADWELDPTAVDQILYDEVR